MSLCLKQENFSLLNKVFLEYFFFTFTHLEQIMKATETSWYGKEKQEFSQPEPSASSTFLHLLV